MDNSKKLTTLEPEFREKIERIIFYLKESEGIDVAIVGARRTMKEQSELYAKGRTTPGKVVTNARAGYSAHNFGLAVDFCPIVDGGLDWDAPLLVWQKIGEAAEAEGLIWGGKFKSLVDRPHVEDPSWKIVQLAWKRGEMQIA